MLANLSEEHQGQQNQQERDQNRLEDGENEQRGGDPLPNRLELAVIEGPCLRKGKNNAYYKFEKKHILKTDLDNTDTNQWKNYIEDNGLCGRVEVQTFFKRKDNDMVIAICNGEGLVYDQNLCVSDKVFVVFHVTSRYTSQCFCDSVNKTTHKVVLGCDVVDNQCLPVHYQKYDNQKPQNNKTCQPNKKINILNY